MKLCNITGVTSVAKEQTAIPQSNTTIGGILALVFFVLFLAMAVVSCEKVIFEMKFTTITAIPQANTTVGGIVALVFLS